MRAYRAELSANCFCFYLHYRRPAAHTLTLFSMRAHCGNLTLAFFVPEKRSQSLFFEFMVDNVEEVLGWVDDGPEFGLDITGLDSTFGSLDERPEKPVFEKAMKYGGFDMGEVFLLF